MDHKHDQLWSEALRRLGVKNIGELLVRDPAQLVVLLSDQSHLTVPAPVAIYGMNVAIAAGGAGTYATIEMECRAPATHILGLQLPPAMAFKLYTIFPDSGLGGWPPTAGRMTAFTTGGGGQNWLHRGTPGVLGGVESMVYNTSGSGALGGGGDQVIFTEPMHVAANRTFGVQCTTANTTACFGILWRETGLGGP